MGKERKSIFLLVFLFLTIFLSGFLYKESFNSYFFQDDWFTLKISQAKNLSDFLTFFVPRTDVIYYRPLGMQVPFFLLRSMFGLDPLAFHLLTYFTHTVNIVLVFLLVKFLLKKDSLSLLVSFLYGTSLVHYTPFFWSATYAFVLGPTFFFLSFIFFLLSLQKGIKGYWLSLAFYFLGLLTNEIVIVLPLILIFYLFISQKIKQFKTVMPYFLIGVLYLLLRFTYFQPTTSNSDYQLEAGLYLLNNLKAYFLWSFNWPEEIKAQFTSFFVINQKFISEFLLDFWVLVISFSVNFLLFFILPIALFIYKRNYRLLKISSFGIFWFFVGLLPVIFFPRHSFSYYLPISLVGLLFTCLTLFDYLLKSVKKISLVFAQLFILLVLVGWTTVAFVSVEFNSKIHWAPRRARVAKELVTKAQKFYPRDNPDYPFIYIQPSSEKKLALNDQEGLKIIYGDENIKTVYKHMIKKQIL